MKQKFNVTGMTCSACSAHVEKSVRSVKGVNDVNVSLLTNSMNVDYDPEQTNADRIVEAVVHGGYGASPFVENTAPTQGNTAEKQQPQNTVSLSRLLVSIGFCIVLMYVSMGTMVGLPLPDFLSGHANAVSFALVQLLLCLPVWYVNRNYFVVGFKRLFQRAPNMDSLIAVGATASAVYAIVVTLLMSFNLGQWAMTGNTEYMDAIAKYHHMLYFESSAMILALVDLGKYFEGRSKTKTGDALNKLRKLAPQKALLYIDGNETETDSKNVKTGDIVVVKAGMSFPADGIVEFGSCFADESAISGESLPREHVVGETVIGGTVNVGGYVRVRVTQAGGDSTLAKIISLVEDASSSKAPIQRLADKISSVFVPVVMSISLVAFIVWLCVGESIGTALNFAVSVLVISCPCALGLATPVAIMVSTGKAAQNGILIKNGETLENISHIKYVALDKTGTVTVGKPQVREFAANIDEKQFFAIVGGIEKQSEHPLGKAVVTYAEEKGITFAEPAEFTTVPGKGVVATLDGHTYAVGNKALMGDQGVAEQDYAEVMENYSRRALTCLAVSCDGKYVGVIGVGDEIKATSREAIALLKNEGLTPILITGDNAVSAKAVCDEVGITEFVAEVLPRQKEQKIAELMTKGKTAMVGDGINDAPALARADIGFAVANGSDIAVDSADVILVKNDLRDVATAVSLSRKTVKNIKQNLFWAFFYNALGIPVAAGVLWSWLNVQLNPMIAAAAMSLSSLFVVTNALRLNFFKAPRLAEATDGMQSANAKTACPIVTESATENSDANQTAEQQNNQQNQTNNNAARQNASGEGENMQQLTLEVEGMMCGHCGAHVTKALQGVDGVSSVEVSLENKSAFVKGASLDAAALKKAVEEAGYSVTAVK